ncbi:MAG TPA: 3-methyl-2-oxobutanoate hydroxymethyltransferase [Actinomycetota bacterium]|jgi:3-methyl-2-oxobutanoate hydroxymethyltransferase|nr:3-methyl-2-oxobutanoate hydroxymethyltransferase [Actinomycetota bacterium]
MGITVRDIRAFKERGEKFVMLTCYDAPSARILDSAGVPILFVGDSLGMVVLGHPSTVPVTIDVMVHHVQAVRRGAPDAFVLGDMPFMSYQASVEEGVRNAGRLLQEAGANAVKLEGGGPYVIELVHRLVDAGIPVMGHLGLTPQSVNQFGGYPVQGREEEQAQRILQDAKDLEAAGAFAVVLETVPVSLSREITGAVSIPTIGIGAGPDTDGQVLVFHDFLGLSEGRLPRFVKRYASLGDEIAHAAREFASDVASGRYPGPEHSYE